MPKRCWPASMRGVVRGEAEIADVRLSQRCGVMANCHLVVLKRPYLEAILAGTKRIESRFTRTKHYAFGRVLAGDKLFLKVSSGPVCAIATVAAVKNFENLRSTTATVLQQILVLMNICIPRAIGFTADCCC